MSLKTPQLCQKTWFGEEIRHFCLRKQTKAAQLKLAAHLGAKEQQCRGVGWLSTFPAHQNWESILAPQPVQPQGLANLHSLYPSPCIPALAWPLSKLPQILWALCRGRVFSPCWDGHHSGGTCCMLVFSWEPSDHFREKIESLSRNTPG